MSAYVIAQMRVNDVDMYREYAAKILPTLKGYGGRLLAANDAEVREGSPPFLRTVVGEFPDLDSARAWYESDDYEAIIRLRTDATEGFLIFVEGITVPAREGK